MRTILESFQFALHGPQKSATCNGRKSTVMDSHWKDMKEPPGAPGVCGNMFKTVHYIWIWAYEKDFNVHSAGLSMTTKSSWSLPCSYFSIGA